MSIDELSSSEWSDSSHHGAEASREISEKQREASKRAQKQLQKTQKDEQKAKGDNDILFAILLRFIKNPLYEPLIPSVVILLQSEYPSSFLLVCIGLVYPDASKYLLERTQRIHEVHKMTTLHTYPEIITFDDRTLDISLREWVTLWMTSGEEYLTSEEHSTILTMKLLTLLRGDSRANAVSGIETIFRFFLAEHRVEISHELAQSYANFILSQLETSLRVFSERLDPDLKKQENIETRDIFGL